MNHDITLPDELNTALASESKDFIVKGRFFEAPWKPIFNIVIGAVWVTAVLYMGTGFDFSNFSVEGISKIIAGLKEAAVNKDYPQLIFPIAFFAIFFSVGIYYSVFKGVLRLFKRGGIFVGTPTKLYNFKKGQISHASWVEFTGNVTVKGNDKSGTLILEKTSGYMLKRAHSSSVYVPHTTYISRIPNANEIAKICKKRITQCNEGKYSD